MRKLCKYCGKMIGAFHVEISPQEGVPELQKTLYFCSDSCANRFIGSITAKRKKKSIKTLRSELEKETAAITPEDVLKIFRTLKSKERDHLTIIGICRLLGNGEKSVADFYTDLNKSMTRDCNTNDGSSHSKEQRQ